jgi:hypothetical protein
LCDEAFAVNVRHLNDPARQVFHQDFRIRLHRVDQVECRHAVVGHHHRLVAGRVVLERGAIAQLVDLGRYLARRVEFGGGGPPARVDCLHFIAGR